MVAFRSRRMDSLLGASLEELTGSAIESLVSSQVEEAYDLDFKAELYGNSDSSRRALASDVSAMANTAGGLIVLGVAEDNHARASAAPGVPLSDSETARMRQIVASLVAPHPVFDLISVPSEADPTHGFYVIAVPRSSAAPHAVLVNDSLRYPKRNGSTTRYLSEPEVAESYRARIQNLADQEERSKRIEDEAIELLKRDENPWLLVSMVPAIPGQFVLDQQAFRDFEQAVLGRDAWSVERRGVSIQRARTARRRLTADGGYGSPEADWVLSEYHTDGAGTYALRLPDMHRRARQERPEEASSIYALVDDEQLVLATLTGLMRLAQHARERAACAGDCFVRARLLPSPNVTAIEIGHTRSHGIAETRSRVAIPGELKPAEAVAPIDELAAPSRTLTATTARLSNDLAQSFGIPELGQLTADGDVRQLYWSRRDGTQDRIVQWAEKAGIPVTDETMA